VRAAANGTAAREDAATSGSFWDSISGGGSSGSGGGGTLMSTCGQRQAQSFCKFDANGMQIDPIADGTPSDRDKYLFTQTFTDAALHPGVQVSDGLGRRLLRGLRRRLLSPNVILPRPVCLRSHHAFYAAVTAAVTGAAVAAAVTAAEAAAAAGGLHHRHTVVRLMPAGHTKRRRACRCLFALCR
jgi:hypothetical protein